MTTTKSRMTTKTSRMKTETSRMTKTASGMTTRTLQMMTNTSMTLTATLTTTTQKMKITPSTSTPSRKMTKCRKWQLKGWSPTIKEISNAKDKFNDNWNVYIIQPHRPHQQEQQNGAYSVIAIHRKKGARTNESIILKSKKGKGKSVEKYGRDASLLMFFTLCAAFQQRWDIVMI